MRHRRILKWLMVGCGPFAGLVGCAGSTTGTNETAAESLQTFFGDFARQALAAFLL